MKPTWLVERGVYRNHAVAFKAEVERQGMVCAEVDYRPGKKPPDDILGCPAIDDQACVVLWGTLPLMQQIQLHHRWVPGGWCEIENLACSTYYAHFRPFLLNSNCQMLPGVEAIRLQEQLFAEFGPEDEVFVRPSSVHKLFTGTVAYKDDFADAIAPSRYDPATLVLVSTPKTIGKEWRVVIAGDEAVAASQYRDYGAIVVAAGCPPEVSQFVSDVLQQVRWRPDSLFMLDVCESDDQLFVLELNSFSCSGLYACDLPAVIRAASEIAERQWAASGASA
jgi:hypothetical protein